MMAACGCADEYIEQILISERLPLAVARRMDSRYKAAASGAAAVDSGQFIRPVD